MVTLLLLAVTPACPPAFPSKECLGRSMGERRLLGQGHFLMPMGACVQEVWAISSRGWDLWAVPGTGEMGVWAGSHRLGFKS